MVQKSRKNIDNLSMDEFNKILNEFTESTNNIENKISDDITPLSKALTVNKKNELKSKLRNNIILKNNIRNGGLNKEVVNQTNELKKMMKHPKMNEKILKLYGDAIIYNPQKSIPKPTDIFDNPDLYKLEYYQYIYNLLNYINENKLDINQLNKILENPYSIYMTTCLELPLNPFNK